MKRNSILKASSNIYVLSTNQHCKKKDKFHQYDVQAYEVND